MLAGMGLVRKCGTGDLSLLLGITARRIEQLVAKKILVREARGLFDTCDAVQRFIAWREGVIAAQHGLGEYGRSRAALYLEKARMARLQREKLEGSLAPVDDFQTAASSLMVVFRNQMLGLPAKLAQQLAQLKTPAEAQELLRAEIYEALLELSRIEIITDNGGKGSKRRAA